MAESIYFIRHGLTVANENHLVQGLDDELSERGFAQAGMLAERMARLSFGKFIASDMKRARQTAEVIAQKTGHKIEFSPLYREIQYPSSLIGVNREDPRIREYWDAMERNIPENPGWRFEDEESPLEIRERISRGFDYAAGQEAESVVVLTHGNFMRKLFYSLLMGDDVFKHWREHRPFILTSNTGITQFIRSPRDPGGWCLRTWNDHAHLA